MHWNLNLVGLYSVKPLLVGYFIFFILRFYFICQSRTMGLYFDILISSFVVKVLTAFQHVGKKWEKNASSIPKSGPDVSLLHFLSCNLPLDSLMSLVRYHSMVNNYHCHCLLDEQRLKGKFKRVKISINYLINIHHSMIIKLKLGWHFYQSSASTHILEMDILLEFYFFFLF